MTNDDKRVQVFLAQAGFGSRRFCEKLVLDKRVKINGRVATLGDKANKDYDRIYVDDIEINIADDTVYYLLNKPKNVVSTSKDPQRRTTIIDLVPSSPRCFSVGRLDFDSEGLIILTNDGVLANQLSHPSKGVEKEYLVQLSKAPEIGVIRKFKKEIEIMPGVKVSAKVSLIDGSLLRFIIHEGKNRQIRKMCEAVGLEVVRLVRIRIGPITDSTLKPGMYRNLTAEEVNLLRSSTRP